MAPVQRGDTVRVHYTGKLTDGSVFDSSRNGDPLEFTVGSGQVIDGFESLVVGMEPGETRTREIPSGEAYGPHDEQLLLEVEKSALPEGMTPTVGEVLALRDPSGGVARATVADVREKTIVLDANHPLAGKDLVFEVELVSIG